MTYFVQIKRSPFEPNTDYTFADAYFQGCEQDFETEEDATAYFKTFEEWEQELLEVDFIPF
jgi:hypothetical protein